MKTENNCIIVQEQVFHIGKNADIEITAILCQNESKYRLEIWSKDTNIINIVGFDYHTGMSSIDVITCMEQLIYENEEYIMDVALVKAY